MLSPTPYPYPALPIWFQNSCSHGITLRQDIGGNFSADLPGLRGNKDN